MNNNLSFEPADENNLTIAEQWLEKIDKPMMEHGWTAGIDRKALRQMKKAAKDAMPEGSPRYTTLYIFEDGSGIYEKRPQNWFVLDAEDVKTAPDYKYPNATPYVHPQAQEGN